MNNWKKTFAVIWTGQLFSTLSSMIVGYAVIFWLSVKTGSAEVLAFATIAALLPQMLLGLFSGVLIDRWDRKKIMIAADVFIAVCSAGLAILFLLGEVRIFYAYILLALRSIGSAFHVPAMQASVPLLAPESELLRVAGVNQMIQSVSIIASPAVAAMLISAVKMPYVLLLDVVGAAIACVSLALVHIPNPKKKDAVSPHFFREMKEGLREITSRPGLLGFFVVGVLVVFFIMPIAAMFPLMTTKHFGGTAFQMGVVETGWGVGLLLGGLALGISKRKFNKVILINSMYLLLGASIAVSGLLPPSGYWIFVGASLVIGIAHSVFSGTFQAVIQKTVDPAALGRVFSIYGSLSFLPSIFGLIQTGLIADRIGITRSFVISGIMIMLVAGTAFFVPAIRNLGKSEKAFSS